MDSILANSWHYSANWAYVVLSRVRTLKGLHLRKHLSLDLSKYRKPDAMKTMLHGISQSIVVQQFDDYMYNLLLQQAERTNAATATQDTTQ